VGCNVRKVSVALFCLSLVGCKLEIEASVTGPVPGSPDKVRVKVSGTGGAELSCSDNACESKKLPTYGQDTIDVTVPPGPKKTVEIKVKKGLRKGSVTIDLAAGGAGSSLALKDGNLSCLPIGCKGRIDIAPGARISLEAPAGTTIDVGGEKLTVPASGTLTSPLKLAASPAIQTMTLDKICTGLTSSNKGTVLASPTITVTLPGKPPMSLKADLDLPLAEQGLSLALADVKKGPVTFPWEKPGEAAKGKRAAVYTSGRVCHDAGAGGATVADLDVIAIAETSSREDECRYILTNGETASGPITLYDQKATVYDRVSGRTLGTKTFQAPKKCSDETSVRGSSRYVTRQTSFVSDNDIATWAATFAK
jgi:hypothetical protein